MDYIHPTGIRASGPYTPVVKAPPFIFVSGQGTYDPDTEEKFLGEFSRQAELAMANLKRCVESAHLTMRDLVKVTVYITDIKQLKTFNEVYPRFFDDQKCMPTRTCVAVSALPGGMDVEVDALALVQ